MSAMASQITSFTIDYSTVYSGADQRKHQSSASLAGLCEGNSPVTSKFPTQRASNAENVSIWWRHHEIYGNQFSNQLQWHDLTLKCREISSDLVSHFERRDPAHKYAKESLKIRGLSQKTSSFQYRNSHYKDKTVTRPSYLYNGNPIPGKTVFIMRQRLDYIEWKRNWLCSQHCAFWWPRTSAGTLMTRFAFRVYTGPTFEGLNEYPVQDRRIIVPAKSQEYYAL